MDPIITHHDVVRADFLARFLPLQLNTNFSYKSTLRNNYRRSRIGYLLLHIQTNISFKECYSS